MEDSKLKPGTPPISPPPLDRGRDSGPITLPPAVRRTMRTSQVPTGEFDRSAVRAQLAQSHGLETPSADETLDAAVELVNAIRPEMDDDGVVQTFVSGLCALLPGRRFVVRLLPRPPREPDGALWTTGPVLEGVSERFRIDRGTLGRFGFHAEQAERAGLEVVERYECELHRAAKGFYA
ncbi:MAG: hypothetical protein H5U40_00685, partial [Polyangiaceae bacterium]|nr:hypothetical protein [Polyangiaceae bacterium]